MSGCPPLSTEYKRVDKHYNQLSQTASVGSYFSVTQNYAVYKDGIRQEYVPQQDLPSYVESGYTVGEFSFTQYNGYGDSRSQATITTTYRDGTVITDTIDFDTIILQEYCGIMQAVQIEPVLPNHNVPWYFYEESVINLENTCNEEFPSINIDISELENLAQKHIAFTPLTSDDQQEKYNYLLQYLKTLLGES